MARWLPLALILAGGCMDGVSQVAGVGAVYTTRCSADMDAQESRYLARCTPEPCAPRFTSVAVSDVVVALDPGRKVVGYRERVCVQDLSNATALFNPVLEPEPNRGSTEENDQSAEGDAGSI